MKKFWWLWCFFRLIWFGWLWCFFSLWGLFNFFACFCSGLLSIAWPWYLFRTLSFLALVINKLWWPWCFFRLIWIVALWCFFRLWSLPGLPVTPFLEVNNLHFIHTIFLIYLQNLFMSSFLFFVKVSVHFHLLITGLNFFSIPSVWWHLP